ncbi:MAG: hypothetical protein DRQ10_06165 [Candidatus Hydrothermota bacterium]|nr:MAG: hypothetical protein DRQ10_06165 [Candidatus Hydrothermae bacterium]
MLRDSGWSLFLLILALVIVIVRFSSRKMFPETQSSMIVFLGPGYVYHDTTDQEKVDSIVIKVVNLFLNQWGKDSVWIAIITPAFTGSEIGGLATVESTIVVGSRWNKRMRGPIREVVSSFCAECETRKRGWIREAMITQKLESLLNSDTILFTFFVGEGSLGTISNISRAFKQIAGRVEYAKFIFVVPETPTYSDIARFMDKFGDLDAKLIVFRDTSSSNFFEGKTLSSAFSNKKNYLNMLDKSLYELDAMEMLSPPTIEDSGVIVLFFDMTKIYEEVFARGSGVKGILDIVTSRYVFEPDPSESLSLIIGGFGFDADTVLSDVKTIASLKEDTNWTFDLAKLRSRKFFKDSTRFSSVFRKLNSMDWKNYKKIHIWFITDGFMEGDTITSVVKAAKDFAGKVKDKDVAIFFLLPNFINKETMEQRRASAIDLLNTLADSLSQQVKVQVVDFRAK